MLTYQLVGKLYMNFRACEFFFASAIPAVETEMKRHTTIDRWRWMTFKSKGETLTQRETQASTSKV